MSDDGTRGRVRVEDVVAELATLRSSDPAARHAEHAIKLTSLTLESFWVEEPHGDADVGADVDDG